MKVVHCKKEKFDVYIGRPSKWGNPFNIGVDGTRTDVITKYEEWLLGARKAPNDQIRPTLKEAKNELTGKTLGCWCHPKPCHGSILIRFVEGTTQPIKE